MEAVHIFRGIDRFKNRRFVNLLWQRQLHQDSVNIVILIQSADDGKQVLSGGCCRQRNLLRLNSYFGASAYLVPHIDRRSIVVANQDGNQTGFYVVLCPQLPRFLGDFVLDLLSDGSTVKKFCPLFLYRNHLR